MRKAYNFKFRAWYQQAKIMTEPFFFSDIRRKEDGFIGYGSNIIMQYTGLKDKNGKEIYEGDIVKRIVNKWVQDQGVVKFGFHKVTSDEWYYTDAYGFYTDSVYTAFEDDEDYEVIGNIYENPELLDG